MASAVGRTINFTPRLPASRFTSSMTGNRPYAPVPMTKRHIARGWVLPKRAAYDQKHPGISLTLSFALVNLTSVDDDIALVGNAVDLEGTERKVRDPHRAPTSRSTEGSGRSLVHLLSYSLRLRRAVCGFLSLEKCRCVLFEARPFLNPPLFVFDTNERVGNLGHTHS